MKKYIFCSIINLMMQPIFAQVSYINNNNSEFKEATLALESVIKKATYIIEVVSFRPPDDYYIPEDNQTYSRTYMIVSKVIRGSHIALGDTIITVWKQFGKGKGIYSIYVNDGEPRLWYAKNSTSCLFLIPSKFPTEPVPDQWSYLLKTTYIPSSIGYFAAIYDSYMGFREAKVAVSVEGLYFNYRSEWYDYLRKFKNINLPEVK